MTDACVYCDQIDDTATKLKQDLRARIARQNLITREPAIMKKIDNDQSLTDNELDILWKEENRSDAIDVMYAKDRNLVDDIAGRAIKSGDETKIAKVGNEIKDEGEICVRKGLCGTDIGIALGLGTIATVGLLSEATGTTWIYDNKTDTYYEAIKIQALDTETKLNGLPAITMDVYANIMKNANLANKIYSEGNMPGIQGMNIDLTEYICQNFAIDAVNALKTAGYDAAAVQLYGKFATGESIWHAAIIVRNKKNMKSYILDPLGYKPPQNILTTNIAEYLTKQYTNPNNYKPLAETYTTPPSEVDIAEMTLIEPQGAVLLAVGTEFDGMIIKDPILGTYTIDHLEVVGDNPEQQQVYLPDVKRIGISPVGKGGLIISQTNLNSEMVKKLAEIDPRMMYNAWTATGKESKTIPEIRLNEEGQ